MAGNGHWSSRAIADLLDTIIDYRGKTPPKSPAGIPLISAANVKAGRVVLDDPEFISLPDYKKWTRRGFTHPGDVLITTEAPAGEVAPYPQNGTYQISRRVMALRPNPQELDSGFLLYALLWSEVKQRLLSVSRGTTVPRVLKTDITGLEIPLPPLPEQRAIAHILGTLDDKIELNRRMNETLESMARAIFKSWFVDFDPVRAKMDGRQPVGMDEATANLFPSEFEHVDGELVPKAWRAGSLLELAAEGRHAIAGGPFGSKLSRKHYTKSGVPVIRGANMSGSSGWFNDRDFVFVSEEKAETLTTNMAAPGDVVFTQRGTLGQVAMIPIDSSFPRYVISQSQMKMTCADGVPGAYVFLYFEQPSTVAYIMANATASGVPHVNLAFLRAFPILIPSRSVITAFGESVEPLVSRITVNDRESESLAALRDTLLPKLLSGQIRVRDAEKAVEEVV